MYTPFYQMHIYYQPSESKRVSSKNSFTWIWILLESRLNKWTTSSTTPIVKTPTACKLLLCDVQLWLDQINLGCVRTYFVYARPQTPIKLYYLCTLEPNDFFWGVYLKTKGSLWSTIADLENIIKTKKQGMLVIAGENHTDVVNFLIRLRTQGNNACVTHSFKHTHTDNTQVTVIITLMWTLSVCPTFNHYQNI